MAADVALITERRFAGSVSPPGDWYYGNILSDDGFLQAALERRGLTSERIDWSRGDVDWSAFRTAVFRTTWDYFDRFGEFSAWLDRAAVQTRLCNSPALVRWNMDKHYLGDLAERGVAVVPSRYLERGAACDLSRLIEETGWRDAVIKPCVSGAARHTYRVRLDDVAEIEAIVGRLLVDEAFLFQPFQPAIVTGGEDSLMMFDGRCTHAVRKVAKPGDFRVQDDHGGTVHPHEPTSAQIELAERAMAACDPRPVYGRVDMTLDERGRWTIMELELIEPELWLRFHPPAAEAFARAIAATL